MASAAGRRIAVMTDGACDLTPEQAAELGISIVPIPLAFPDGSTSDSSQFSTGEFWEALLADYTSLPKTSKPTPFDFERRITELANAGYEGVLIVTISTGLSGTYDSALDAAENALIPTRVVNSCSVTWGLVALCQRALAGIDAGLTLDEVADYVTAVAASMRALFVVDTLEYLVRGGRAGRAAGLLAAALDIKPLLSIEDDGVIAAIKKCRGRKKAYQKMAKQIAHEAHALRDSEHLHYLMLQSDDPDDAAQLHEVIRAAGEPGHYEGTEQIGTTVGIYCGPKTAACIFWQDSGPEAFLR